MFEFEDFSLDLGTDFSRCIKFGRSFYDLVFDFINLTTSAGCSSFVSRVISLYLCTGVFLGRAIV